MKNHLLPKRCLPVRVGVPPSAVLSPEGGTPNPSAFNIAAILHLRSAGVPPAGWDVHRKQRAADAGAPRVFPMAAARLRAGSAFVLAGCRTPIGADMATPRQAYLDLHQNALNSSRLQRETRRSCCIVTTSKQAFKKNPDATLEKLQAIACTDDRRDLLYALSELNYWNADRQSRSVKPGVPQLRAQQLFRLGHLRLSLSVRRQPRSAAESVRPPLPRGGRFLQSRPCARG